MFPRRIGFPLVAFAPDDGGGSASAAPAAAPAGGGGEASAAPSTPSSGASPSPSGSDAGAAPSPSPSTPPGGGAAPTTPQSVESSFAGLEFIEGDEDTDFGINPTVEPTAPAPVAPAAAAPVAPVVPPAQPPVQPATATAPATPAPTAASATGPQGATASLPSPAEPARIGAAFLENVDAFADHLATTDFALSPADIEAMETDAVAYIPKLMARTFVRAQAAALNQMERVIPAMMQRQQIISKRNEANEGKFYARWTNLDPAVHGEIVGKMARTYRQMNPSATLEQMIEDLGPVVMMTAKVAPGTQPNGQHGAAPAAAAPARRPGVPPSPFRPAGTSAASGVSPNPVPDNPWMGLAGDQDDE